jgi:hypothetical protein
MTVRFAVLMLLAGSVFAFLLGFTPNTGVTIATPIGPWAFSDTNVIAPAFGYLFARDILSRRGE